MWDHPELSSLLDDLAGTAMMVRPGDGPSLASLEESFEALKAALGEEGKERLGGELTRLQAALEEFRSTDSEDPGKYLDLLRREIAALQDGLARFGEGPREEAARQGRFLLPEWVEESVFQEFLASQDEVFEEIEGILLALENGGGEEDLAGLRRKIHSLKGEAGVLGLEAFERVCHAIEDKLEEEGLDLDVLFAVKDWLVRALQLYAGGEIPREMEILERLRGGGEPDSPGEGTGAEGRAPAAEASSRGAGPAKEEHLSGDPGETGGSWDEDTLEMVVEFIQEGEEGLAQADEILLQAQKGGLGVEQTNALFRVFHTIKGVAGFLELGEITQLAHTTETMLDRGRTGVLSIEGTVLDLVFDATSMMRKMLEGLKEGVSLGRLPEPEPGLRNLLARLEEATREGGSGKESGPLRTETPPSPGDDPSEGKGRRGGRVSPAEGGRDAGRKGPSKLKEVVKVDLDRVDNLVALIGELVIVESMVVNDPMLADFPSAGLRKHLGHMSKITRDLQDLGMRMRMVPVKGVFQKMARMVRDLSRKNGKSVSVHIEGENTEMDRSMVEQIGDPLVHMIRNAVDHGIESAKEREKKGKPPTGTIGLRAFHQGGTVVVEVTDDGRGLDRDGILAKARQKGIVQGEENLSDGEIYELIFEPGFSTAEKVTEISGRGVGMDVVRRNIESIRGRVMIDSVPGEGTTFTMVLPLTLAIIDGMLVACGGERFIIPTLSVIESVRPDRSMVFSVTGRGEIMNLRGETFPLFRLSRLLGIAGAAADPTGALVVVVESRGKKLGLLVDDVLNQQQVVIKSLGEGLPEVRYLSGAAIMSDGRVGLILNTDEIRSLVDQDTFSPSREGKPESRPGKHDIRGGGETTSEEAKEITP